MFRVRLDGSSWILADDPLAGLPFDDDALAYLAFAPPEVPVFGGMGFMASLGRRDDGGREAGIRLLDEDPSNVNHLIVRGYPCEAGALAFAPDGSLYCVAAPGEDCPAPKSIYRFSPEQVARAVQEGPLRLLDAEVVVMDTGDYLWGLFWFSDLLYVIKGYGATPSALLSFAPHEGFSPVPFPLAIDRVHPPSMVAFQPGILPFSPGAGKAGGTMLVNFEFSPCRSTLVEVVPGTSSPFLRGDSNSDGATDIGDAIAVLGFLFLGETMNDCEDAADVNDDGKLDISDPVRLLGHLFLGSERPPDPFTACGSDPTPDDLDCNAFGKCP